LRISSGALKGLVLKSPPKPIRPTGERARQVLFSVLGRMVEGARFLDLYAGSGVVGLEAISRGAREAVFVESSPRVFDVLLENIRRCGLEGKARPILARAERALRRLAEEGEKFEVVFLDPPYRFWEGEAERVLPLVPPVLAEGGVAVAQRPSNSALPLPEELEIADERNLGETLLTFLVASEASPPHL